MSVGRQEAFEIFKRDYADNQVIEENKLGLKNRYNHTNDPDLQQVWVDSFESSKPNPRWIAW